MDLSGVLRILIAFSCCILVIRSQNNEENEHKDWNTDKFKEEASQTFKLAFHKYNPGIRPPKAFVDVKMNVVLRHIRHLDVLKQELQAVLDIEMVWHDGRFKWLATIIPRIMVNSSVVWIPDILNTNGVLPVKSLYPNTVRVSNKGHMVWTKKELVTTYCRTSPHMAVHKCPISFGFLANQHEENSDRLFANNSTLTVAGDFSNNEWELISATPLLKGDDENSTAYTSFEVMLELEKKNLDKGSYTMASSMGQNSSAYAGSIKSTSPPAYDVTAVYVVTSLYAVIFASKSLGRGCLIR